MNLVTQYANGGGSSPASFFLAKTKKPGHGDDGRCQGLWSRNRLATVALMLALGAGAGAGTARAADDSPGEVVIRGKTLFHRTCVFCHVRGGRKAGKGPKLAGSERNDEYMFGRISKGKRGRMPAFGKSLSDQDIKAIVAYIRSLREE